MALLKVGHTFHQVSGLRRAPLDCPLCGRPNEKYNLPGCPYPTTSLILFLPPSTSCPGLGVGAGRQPSLPTASDQLRTLYQQARGDELGPTLRASCTLPCIVPTPSRLAPLPPAVLASTSQATSVGVKTLRAPPRTGACPPPYDADAKHQIH